MTKRNSMLIKTLYWTAKANAPKTVLGSIVKRIALDDNGVVAHTMYEIAVVTDSMDLLFVLKELRVECKHKSELVLQAAYMEKYNASIGLCNL